MTKLPLKPLWVLLFAGCGGIGDHSYTPPYMTLSGTIRQITLDHVPTNVHVALIWEGDGGMTDGHVIRAADDLAVASTFPTQFTLDVKSLPPDFAMVHCSSLEYDGDDGTTHNICAEGFGLDKAAVFGRAEVVAYEDLNGNGKLDIVPDDSPTPSPDRAIGRSKGTAVRYLPGQYRVTPKSNKAYTLFPTVNGFSVTTSTLSEPTLDGCAKDPHSCLSNGLYPQSTQLLQQPASIDLTVESDSIDLAQYTCGTARGMVGGSGERRLPEGLGRSLSHRQSAVARHAVRRPEHLRLPL